MTEPKGRSAEWTEPKGRGADWTEPKGRGADWTEERGTSDEGRRCLKASRRLKENTVAVVTGTGGSLGRAIARRLAADDHVVAVTVGG